MPAINIQVSKNGSESGANLLRRFTRKVQESRIVPNLKGARYSQRKLSHYVVKKNALRKISKTQRIEHLKKMGKMRSGR
ncbi:hypothetical protein KC852_01600 [Candidatus Nomurabacteria bacterium]|nr:hypothetical protein [Candidatus Nomurabacteria bacterium]